jgi:hypothetical protein
VIALAPEALRRLYDDWQVESRRRGAGLVAIKPPNAADASP